MENTRRILKKLIFFALIAIILDFSTGSVLESLYFSQKSIRGCNNRLFYSLNKTNEKVLIFGASTATHGYIPEIIEDSLRLTCYNVGFEATNIYFFYTILSSVLDRYSPEIIILDLTAWGLVGQDDDFDKLSDLYPFYSFNKNVKSTIDSSGKYEKFKMLSKSYRFNSQILYILKQNLISKEYNGKGYFPLYGYWKDDMVFDSLDISKYDLRKVSCFENFIDDANRKGCRIIVVSSPVFRHYCVDQYSQLENILKTKDVRFWNFRNDTSFVNHREYFYDYVHLNHTGAEYFTKRITDSLKTLTAS